MSEKQSARPRQVTMAGYIVIGGSVILLLAVVETLTGLRSMETREAVEEFLAEPPGNGLGLTTESALSAIRVLGMVTAGCAAAAGILGYHVMQRNRAARLALTLVAVPMMIAGMVTAGGFVSSMVAAAAFLLWLQPSRDWFAGRTPARPVSPTPPVSSSSSAPPAPAPSSPSGPPDAAGHPDAPGASPSGWPVGPIAPGTVTGPPPAPREVPTTTRPASPPRPVVLACVLTWIFAGIAAGVMVVGMVYLALEPDALLAEMQADNAQLEQAGLTEESLVVLTWISVGSVVLWALGAIVLAWLVHRGLSWARILLMVSTFGAIGLLLLGVFAQPLMLIPLVAATATLSMLSRPESRAWAVRNSLRD